jgi:hypothetical protein
MLACHPWWRVAKYCARAHWRLNSHHDLNREGRALFMYQPSKTNNARGFQSGDSDFKVEAG